MKTDIKNGDVVYFRFTNDMNDANDIFALRKGNVIYTSNDSNGYYSIVEHMDNMKVIHSLMKHSILINCIETIRLIKRKDKLKLSMESNQVEIYNIENKLKTIYSHKQSHQ